MNIAASDERASFWFALSAGALLAIATAIRFRNLGTTLFEDEIWVANLLRTGNFAPHTYSTPPLFYLIGRLWTTMRGFSDVALREPAAFFGVAVCAMAFAAPRPRLTRFVWAALFAFSSPLLFYSARLKQYTLEASVVTLLIVLFLRALERDRAATWVAFFGVAIASVMLLHASVFVVAAAGAVSLFKARRPWIIAAFAAAGAAFLAAWVLYMAPGPTTPQLHGDMEQWFAETGRWVDSPGSLVRNTLHWVGHSYNIVRFWWIVMPVLIIWWIARTRPWVELTLALLPVAAIVAASVAHRYPYGEVRLMIVCLPALFLMTAQALTEAARRVPLALLVLLPFVFNGVARDSYNASYMRVEDLRVIVDTVASTHHPGELIYADPSYAAPLHYYAAALRPDLRPIIVNAPSGPGWYVQRESRFTAPRGSVALRTGGVVALRIP